MWRNIWKNLFEPLVRGHNMSTISINGKTYQGSNVSIINGVVKIDGVIQENDVKGVVEVRVLEGTINHLTTDASVTCNDVTGNIDAGGSVTAKTVGGGIDCGGSVNCGDVDGGVDAGGSVNCGKVAGSVDAGGSVRTS